LRHQENPAPTACSKKEKGEGDGGRKKCRALWKETAHVAQAGGTVFNCRKGELNLLSEGARREKSFSFRSRKVGNYSIPTKEQWEVKARRGKSRK